MANPVQWTVDQLWSQIQNLKGLIDGFQVDLEQNKLDLQALYANARNGNLPADVYGPPDPRVVAAYTAALEPLIHQNTILRLNYLVPIKQKFNDAVRTATADLQRINVTPPPLYGLSGLGDPVVTPGVLIASAVVVGLVTVAIAWVMTGQQKLDGLKTQTAAMAQPIAAILGNRNLTPEQQTQQLGALKGLYQAGADQLNAGSPKDPFDLSSLYPILGVVAAIVLLPPILGALPKRQAAA